MMRYGIRRLSSLAALLLVACTGPSATAVRPPESLQAPTRAPDALPTSTLWCMVGEGGLAMVFPTPQRQLIPRLNVTDGPVEVANNVYHDVFGGGTAPPEITGTIAIDTLPDSSVLVWVQGTGEWYENTALLLQLRIEASECSLLSCHLFWSADVEPYRAWCAIEEGSIALDCRGDNGQSELRVAFDVRGSRSVSGTFHTPLFPVSGGVPAFAVAHLTDAAQR